METGLFSALSPSSQNDVAKKLRSPPQQAIERVNLIYHFKQVYYTSRYMTTVIVC